MKKGLQKLKKLLYFEMFVVPTYEKFNKKKLMSGVDVIKSLVFNGKMPSLDNTEQAMRAIFSFRFLRMDCVRTKFI